mmetsp:Transcript_79566/g.140447  ORF Transcript_79566/g.140447 Transcript_79566/m.140447 type:complete len:125 (-) Transcript_79566:989-1363(-)
MGQAGTADPEPGTGGGRRKPSAVMRCDPTEYRGGDGERNSDFGFRAGAGLETSLAFEGRGDGVSRKRPEEPNDEAALRPGVEAARAQGGEGDAMIAWDAALTSGLCLGVTASASSSTEFLSEDG